MNLFDIFTRLASAMEDLADKLDGTTASTTTTTTAGKPTVVDSIDRAGDGDIIVKGNRVFKKNGDRLEKIEASPVGNPNIVFKAADPLEDDDVVTTRKFKEVNIKNINGTLKDFNGNDITAFVNTTFKVEGDGSKFYPVYIHTGYLPVHFTISRDKVHWDSTWWGRVYYEAKAFTTHWGHGAEFYKDIVHLYRTRQFIADRTVHYQTGIIVLWLRGNSTYRLTGSGITLGDHSATSKRLKHPKYYDNTYSILDDTADNRKLGTFNYLGA